MRTLILNAVCLFLAFYTNAQAKKQDQDITKDTMDLDKLIDMPFIKGSGKIMTNKNVNKLLGKYQYQIGGVGVKEGKSNATSAVLDEKSLTINASLKPLLNKMFFVQPRITMAGTDNVISIFSKDKFNKIYTGGVNFIAFCTSSIFAYEKDVVPMHNNLRVERTKFIENLDNSKRKYNKLITETKDLLIYSKNHDPDVYKYFNNEYFVFDPDDKKGEKQLLRIEKIKNNIQKLVELQIITDDIATSNSQTIIDNLRCILDSENAVTDIIVKEYLAITDSIQLNMKVSKSIKWWSGGVNYNSESVPVILNNSSTSPSTFYNQYVTFNVSFNRQKFGNKYNFICSPNLSYSNSRNFNDDNKKTVNFQSSVTLGGVSAQNIDSTISFFNNVPARLNTWNIELPLILYNTKSNFGFDLAIRVGANNVNNDNIGARFGLFVPVSKNDNGEAVLIEPLFSFSKLFSSSTNKFFRDNVSIGINLSVSLPKLIN